MGPFRAPWQREALFDLHSTIPDAHSQLFPCAATALITHRTLNEMYTPKHMPNLETFPAHTDGRATVAVVCFPHTTAEQ